MRSSANLGFLWSDRPLSDAVRAAKAAGFDAVECHWPYGTDASETAAALRETGRPMPGISTRRGRTEIGENGLAALPGRETGAGAAIGEALDYARTTGTGAVHVMAGFSGGPHARAAFIANLDHACNAAAAQAITILIEPLSRYNAPGYFLNGTAQAAAIIRAVGRANLHMMFDCYHILIMEGDVTGRLETLLPPVGHIQIASVPDRGIPDHGELDYGFVLRRIFELGWDRPIGAEYLPDDAPEPDMSWLTRAPAALDAGCRT